MRILILSDLHLEVWRDAPKQAQELLSKVQSRFLASRPDVIVLAGDVDGGDRAVAWADQSFPNLPVIYVHGNHEAYGQKIDSLKGKLAEACAATGHIHLLDRGELVLGGIRFLGATLWTDFQLLGPDSLQDSMQSAAVGMNDYRKIRLAKAGYRRIKPLDVAQWHYEERSWLQQRLGEPFSGSTVVVTHMAPSSQSIPERYTGHPLSAAFASHLDPLVSKADLWIHGHIHDSMDYLLSGTRVICNPLGYPVRGDDGIWSAENSAFNPDLVVEIGATLPGQQILQDAAHMREALASQWLGAAEVGALLSGEGSSGSDRVSRLRRNGQLLAVYVTSPIAGYRYPTWQFRADGQSVDCLSEILKVLRDYGPFHRESDGLRRTTGWGEVEWFMSPHVLLDGASPSSMLATHPARVLHAAGVEFQGEV
ncbi:metallophosphoesterase [Stenotrophomonas maltophilia]|uniref:metallophosphoesterase n=1 Tax=Stenotrophomonas maltophilia TaxID=40324 RepID=UPI002B1CDA1B|nr:metallophosphoesterase [Stenotrophomonas maltophilia]